MFNSHKILGSSSVPVCLGSVFSACVYSSLFWGHRGLMLAHRPFVRLFVCITSSYLGKPPWPTVYRQKAMKLREIKIAMIIWPVLADKIWESWVFLLLSMLMNNFGKYRKWLWISETRFTSRGAGEIAQQLGVLTVLPQDSSSVPSTFSASYNCLTPSSCPIEYPHIFSVWPQRHTHTWCR